MKKVIKTVSISLIIVFLMLILSACGCEHEWAEATCQAPKTCTLCGKTEGAVADHTWEEATCLAPKTCTLCGKTEGEVADHVWEEATCDAPKTCVVCQKTDGEKNGHVATTWKVANTDYVSAKKTLKKKCEICGTTIETKTEKLSSLHDYELFLCSPKEFTQRLNNMFDAVDTGLSAESGTSYYDGSYVCGILYKGKNIGTILFGNSNTGAVSAKNKNEKCFGFILTAIENTDYSAEVVAAIAMTLDPTLDIEQVDDWGMEIAQTAITNGSTSINGITYAAMGNSSSGLYFGASIAH